MDEIQAASRQDGAVVKKTLKPECPSIHSMERVNAMDFEHVSLSEMTMQNYYHGITTE